MYTEFSKLPKKLMFLLIVTISVFGQTFFAAASSNFSVRAIIPNNQIDKNQTYFDLRMSPGEKQTVQVIVDNSEDEEIISRAALNSASTGSNGLIVYNKSDARDESLLVSITDIAKITNPENTISAKGSATVDIEIQMPDKPFDGVILGGLVFTVAGTSENQATGEITLNNEYAYVIGLKITQTDTEIAPDFKLNSKTASLVNYRNAVVINVSNIKPLIVKGMEVDAKIYKKNSSEVFRDLNLSYAEMAPNSNGDFIVDWKSSTIDSGIYRLHMIVRYQGKEWVWDEDFTVSQGEADYANNNAVDLPARPIWIYVAVVLGMILIAVIAYLLGRKKAKKDND